MHQDSTLVAGTYFCLLFCCLSNPDICFLSEKGLLTLCIRLLFIYQGTVLIMDQMGYNADHTPFTNISNTIIIDSFPDDCSTIDFRILSTQGIAGGDEQVNVDLDDDSDWLHRNETFQANNIVASNDLLTTGCVHESVDNTPNHTMKRAAYFSERYKNLTPVDRESRRERLRLYNKTPKRKDAKTEYGRKRRALQSDTLNQGSIAMEDPTYTPEVGCHRTDATQPYGSSVTTCDWVIPEFVGTPFLPTSIQTEDVGSLTLSTEPLSRKHHVLSGARPAILGSRNQQFEAAISRNVATVTEDTISDAVEGDDWTQPHTTTEIHNNDDETDEDIKIDGTQDESIDTDLPDTYNKVYSNMPEETHMLKSVPNCGYCNAKKFEYEPPGFCCRGGKDSGIYTFRAQGMMYHNIKSFGREGGAEHKHLELYFYDDDPNLEHRYRMCRKEHQQKDKDVIKQIVSILCENPYSEHLRSMGHVENLDDYRITLNLDQSLNQKTYNTPITLEVAAVWIEGSERRGQFSKSVMLHGKDRSSHGIRSYHGCYDALSYPLFFPRGELGWHANIPKVGVSMGEVDAYRATHRASNANDEDAESPNHLCVSVRDYYRYKFQIRPGVFNPILHGKRLFQQFAVDTYIKIESSHLDFIRKNQDRLRADLYQGLVDTMLDGDIRAEKVGKRTVLSSSFIGGPRDMRRRYMDAMALVRKFGKPDIFLTMTCNPNWDEIRRELLPGQTPQDRLDLVVRVFHAKLHELNYRLTKQDILGKVRAYVYVVEFQKRGLPHAYFLLIMQRKYKLTCLEQYDLLISADIPDKKYHELRKMVIKHMMHGPCGSLNPNCPCTKGRASCKNHYPRPFSDATLQGKDSYPVYRRRDYGRKEKVRGCELDNRWVVPYNPYLLRLFNCHINVEACGSIKAVKYLFKYIYKGHDRAYVVMRDASKTDDDVDEIKQYRDARWVTPPEALWRIYGFELSQNSPPVMQLQLHLPNMHMVAFHDRQMVQRVVNRPDGIGTATTFCHNTGVLNMLQSMGKDIKTFPLPPIIDTYDDAIGTAREVYEEESIEPTVADVALKETLNEEQRAAYDKIMSAVDTDQGGLFFVDGPGGTGKTYLYRVLLATLRSQNKIAVATATSGVAASIMPGGRTAHSRFKIPLTIDDGAVCSFTKQSGTAELLRKASLIIWDEASMTKRQAVEALDNSMRDIMGRPGLPFGGKTIAFGGDFRQVLPVVRKGSRAQVVASSLRMSYLWESMSHLKLVSNMRAKNDPWFAEFLLRIGGGTEVTNRDGDIRLPGEVCVPYSGSDSDLDNLIDYVFPNLNENISDSTYITSRVILSTRNDWVDMINVKMIDRFQGAHTVYHSFDSAMDDPHNYYPPEFLNTLTPNGLPPHVLKLKIGCLVILLRNIDPANGLCNGTRLVVRGFQRNSIDVEIVLGQHAGKRIFLPRIPLCPSDDEMFPFQFKRKQFPIRLSFAMTVNKAQGQTIPNVGVYLPESVFSHGQLYVALSRATARSNIKILVIPAVDENKRSRKGVRKNPTVDCGTYTKNIVYKELEISSMADTRDIIALSTMRNESIISEIQAQLKHKNVTVDVKANSDPHISPIQLSTTVTFEELGLPGLKNIMAISYPHQAFGRERQRGQPHCVLHSYHLANTEKDTTVGMEVTRNFSTKASIVTFGTCHALDPTTTMKACN
ncbi:ATP-dependent DNA helicase PIF1 [Zea mays]|uniref:ATP-dependent DNA helicase n=1 Tax=Zea mays TaxID=4577 RepID=A0A3L6EYU5_MAIZE|nr:ATP-dependent DNA helicase PIF1 [Zea mays]